ncbi:MAG: glycoside hydrolase family 15 protein [Anaerolineales bacterium]
MPRDIPLGNGNLLVAFDRNYEIRDLYWPHVGQENHAMGHAFRTGVWVAGQLRWLDDPGWERELKYKPDTLVSAVTLKHPFFDLMIKASDVVDFHEDLLVRRFDITNLSENSQEVRLFFHQDFHIGGSEFGDTAYYEPQRRAVIHYKGAYWFLVNGAVLVNDQQPAWAPTEDTAPGYQVGVHGWSCGLKEVRDLQGTWRDAEDGQLSGNAIANGPVDSTISFTLHIPGNESRSLYVWMAAASNFDQLVTINRLVRQRGPQAYLERASAFWNLWLTRQLPDLTDLPEKVSDQYKTSLLVMRTQIDNRGAIIAANDSDIFSYINDSYSYMWPRDGALVANALNQAGYLDLPRQFFKLSARVLTNQGYLLHKYNPDGTLASSWHPWYRDGEKELPIQEDESALVLWSLGRHFRRHGDVYFIKPLYRGLICPIADFLVEYRDQDSGLPLPSYGLWEERRGILSWTAGAVWGGLTAAADFAENFGEQERANNYRKVAAEIKMAVERHLWQPDLGYFAKLLYQSEDKKWQADLAVDASLCGLWQFGMYTADDPKISSTMQAIQERLRVKTEVGGIARYEDDGYHQVSQDISNIPGNPWFVSTLWVAEWLAETALSEADLAASLELLVWAAERSLPSGIMAEQLHPFSGEPLSVSPLTWSHAAYVASLLAYLRARERLV